MAVLAPEGDCEIRFVYTTPGLLIGCIISAIAVIIAAIYIIICHTLRTFRPQNWVVEYPEGVELNDRFDEYNSKEIHAETGAGVYVLPECMNTILQKPQYFKQISVDLAFL